MPLITVKAPAPALDPDTYLATLVGVRPLNMVTQYSKPDPKTGKPMAQDFIEWTWDVDGTEITSMCTLNFGEKATMTKILSALLGAGAVKVGMELEENDLVGNQVMIQVGLNDQGFSKIEGYVAAPKGKAEKQGALAALKAEVKGPAEAPAVTQTVSPKREDDEPEDDLPF